MSRREAFVRWLALYVILTGILLGLTAFGVFLVLTNYADRLPLRWRLFPRSFVLVLFVEGVAIVLIGSMPARHRTMLPPPLPAFPRRLLTKPPPARYDWLLIFVGVTLLAIAFCFMVAWNV
jgi:hypothetical protein